MSVIASVLVQAEEAAHSLPIPPPVYGAIALCIFALLAFVTVSYRDVANRHSHKASSSEDHGHGGH